MFKGSRGPPGSRVPKAPLGLLDKAPPVALATGWKTYETTYKVSLGLNVFLMCSTAVLFKCVSVYARCINVTRFKYRTGCHTVSYCVD